MVSLFNKLFILEICHRLFSSFCDLCTSPRLSDEGKSTTRPTLNTFFGKQRERHQKVVAVIFTVVLQHEEDIHNCARDVVVKSFSSTDGRDFFGHIRSLVFMQSYSM